MIYIKSLIWEKLIKVGRVTKLELIIKVINFLRSLQKLKRYNKRYLIYSRD